jgi:hypothetical protein
LRPRPWNIAGGEISDAQYLAEVGRRYRGTVVAGHDAQDGSVYMSGTSTSFGAGFQDAFVVRVQADGKAGEAATWGGPGFETGGGVSVTSSGTIVLGATTTVPPPYALLDAPRKVSNPHGTFGVAAGALTDATGVVAAPAAGVTASNGSTIYSGNFEAALVRFIF